MKQSRILWGLPVINPFSVSCFLLVQNRLHATSLTFPEFQRADSNSCLSKGEAAETRKELSGNNSAALGSELLSYCVQVGGEVIWQCSRNLALGLKLLSSMWEGALVSAEQLKETVTYIL